MILDDFLHADVADATRRNKMRYARRWGYDVVVPSIEQIRAAAPGLPVAWAKFPLMAHLLRRYDYVLMIDADAIFMRDDISLHAPIRQMEREQTSVSPNYTPYMLREPQQSPSL